MLRNTSALQTTYTSFFHMDSNISRKLEEFGDTVINAHLKLKKSGIKDAKNDIRHILNSLDMTNAVTFDAYEKAHFNSIIDRRAKHEPLAKILGKKSFWKSEFMTTRDTFDPDPNSEALIAATLETAKQGNMNINNILDLGTGTGCLLLSLLQEFPKALGIGTDITHKAISVAEKNAKKLQLQNRLKLVTADWIMDGKLDAHNFDIVISNPPRIGEDDSGIDLETKYNPKISLYAGKDGLDAFRVIFRDLNKVLKPITGRFITAIEASQLNEILNISQKYGFVLCKDFFYLSDEMRVLSFRAI